MTVSPGAGEPAEASMVVNVPQLVTVYYAEAPDPCSAGTTGGLRHLRTSWFRIRQGVQ